MTHFIAFFNINFDVSSLNGEVIAPKYVGTM